MTKTLFGRTSLIITSTLLVFLLVTISIVGYFIIMPVGKKNAQDLASLILLSAKTYVELPLETRLDFVNELSINHQLFLGNGNEPLEQFKHLKPHFSFMQKALSKNLGSNVNIAAEKNNLNRHWVDITLASQTIRIGFDQQRIGMALPYVAIYLIFILLLMAIVSSLLLVRKITKPIKNLSQAAKIIGSGGMLKPLPEEGLQELAETAKAFNKMSNDVRSLLENRTILLGGISHDLRTPLTRMKLALEMLPGNVDNELKDELKKSITNMELIIKEYMHLTKGLEDDNIETIHIKTFIADIINELNPINTQSISLLGDDNFKIDTHTTALHRVLFNLIENAIRYGDNKPVSISWKALNTQLSIEISDQGKGIPEQFHQYIFRPFYRLESSRNRENGGTGLGLAIVDQIITKQGWNINITSSNNTGTTIIVVL